MSDTATETFRPFWEITPETVDFLKPFARYKDFATLLINGDFSPDEREIADQGYLRRDNLFVRRSLNQMVENLNAINKLIQEDIELMEMGHFGMPVQTLLRQNALARRTYTDRARVFLGRLERQL